MNRSTDCSIPLSPVTPTLARTPALSSACSSASPKDHVPKRAPCVSGPSPSQRPSPLLLLVAPAIHTRSNRHIARTDRASQSLPHALPATAPSMAVSPARPHLLPRAAHRESLPKQDVFPTPFPITPEEQALATVALRAPAPELHALAEAQQKDDESSCIAANGYQLHKPPDQGGN